MQYWNRWSSAARVIVEQTAHTPPMAWLTIILLAAIAYILFRVFVATISILVRRRRSSKTSALAVVISDDDETSTFFLTANTRKTLGLFEHQTVLLQGLRDNGERNKGRSKLVEVRRRNASQTGLQDDQIEMSYRLFEMLFPDTEVQPGELSICRFRFSPIHLKRGMQQYWFSTNDQLQYQNRFSVYLGFGLTVLQLLIGWMPH